MLRFEWDESKNKENFKKHGIRFGEVTPVFEDPFGRMFFDQDHSESEDRFVLIGTDSYGRILVVVHHHREGEEAVRVISARRATKKEAEFYEERI